MNLPLRYKDHPASEVSRVVDEIKYVIDGESPELIHIVGLVLALFTAYADISPSQLTEGVKGASEWVALYVDSLDTPKEKAN